VENIVIGNIQIKKVAYDLDDHDFAKAINYGFEKLGDVGMGLLALSILPISIYGMVLPFL